MKISYENCTCTEGKDYKGGDPENAQWVQCEKCDYWDDVHRKVVGVSNKEYESRIKAYRERTEKYHQHMNGSKITQEPNDCLTINHSYIEQYNKNMGNK